MNKIKFGSLVIIIYRKMPLPCGAHISSAATAECPTIKLHQLINRKKEKIRSNNR